VAGQQAAQQQPCLPPGSSTNSSLITQTLQSMRGAASASAPGAANVVQQLPRPPEIRSSPGRPIVSQSQQQQQQLQNAPVSHSWSGQRASQSAAAMQRLQVLAPAAGGSQISHIIRSLTGLPDDMQQQRSRHAAPAMLRRLPVAQTAWQAAGDAGSTPTAAAAGGETGGSRLGAALAPSPRQVALALPEDSAAHPATADTERIRARSPFSAAAAASLVDVQQHSVSPAAAAQQRLVRSQPGTRGGFNSSSQRISSRAAAAAAELAEDDAVLSQQAQQMLQHRLQGQPAREGGMQRRMAASRGVPAAAAAALSEGGGRVTQQMLQLRASPQGRWASEGGMQRPGTSPASAEAGNVYVAQQKAWLRLQRHSQVQMPPPPE
jgi:hypothetical protein